MALDLFDTFPEARARLEQADEVLGFELTKLMFDVSGSNDAAEKLRATEVTQPALYVHSMAAWAVAAPKLTPSAVAGHSLGEYSALAAAGAISFADGLRLVRLRGEQMAAAGSAQPGTMAALLGAEDGQVEALCAAVSTPISVVVPANYNSPGQVVISGHEDAVARAIAQAAEFGARKAVGLAVGGAFHSPLMEAARAGLASALAGVAIESPICPVYLNITADRRSRRDPRAPARPTDGTGSLGADPVGDADGGPVALCRSWKRKRAGGLGQAHIGAHDGNAHTGHGGRTNGVSSRLIGCLRRSVLRRYDLSITLCTAVIYNGASIL